jgi:hypothetical protein
MGCLALGILAWQEGVFRSGHRKGDRTAGGS